MRILRTLKELKWMSMIKELKCSHCIYLRHIHIDNISQNILFVQMICPLLFKSKNINHASILLKSLVKISTQGLYYLHKSWYFTTTLER